MPPLSLTQAKYGEAIATLRSVASSSLAAARDERARLASADARVQSGDLAGGRAALEEAIRAFPDSAMSHWKLGRLQLLLSDEAGALRSFQTAAALPSLGGAAHVYAAIGRIRHNQLDLDGAVSAYSRRVELTPNDASAHVDLGDVYRAQDRLDEALVEYLIASLIDATNVTALATAAQIHAAAGRDEAAVRLLRRAVALDPSASRGSLRAEPCLAAPWADRRRPSRAAGVRAASAEGDAGRSAAGSRRTRSRSTRR